MKKLQTISESIKSRVIKESNDPLEKLFTDYDKAYNNPWHALGVEKKDTEDDWEMAMAKILDPLLSEIAGYPVTFANLTSGEIDAMMEKIRETGDAKKELDANKKWITPQKPKGVIKNK